MKAVILVGGLGTRLRPLTNSTCKAMIPVLNRPFLEHVLCYLKRHHIDDIILSLGYMPDQIQGYFGDGSAFGVRLNYVAGCLRLGTAGAVKHAERYLDDNPFLVLNGDIFTDMDLGAMFEFHRKEGAKATIAVTPVEDPSQYGVVETDPQGWVSAFVEKPPPEQANSHFINGGIYILERELLGKVPTGTNFMFEHHLFPELVEARVPFFSYPTEAYWMDMGTPHNYLQLQRDLLNSKCATPLHTNGANSEPSGNGAQTNGSVILGEGCSISNDVQIQGPSVLGRGCRISEGAVVNGSVLWKNVEVGRQAKLVNCVVGDDCVIGDECQLHEGTVLGSRVVIQGPS
jgi:mannose-1-phosphate guanylyltransferase